MAEKKILVTGGGGFIGGNFVQYMVNKYPNYDIYNLDLLTYAGDISKHQSIEGQENYYFIKADIRDRKTIISLFENRKFDYAVHFAAESHVDRKRKRLIKQIKTFHLRRV
jgi:dTDP-glucose 4,6-dehydratase